MLEEYWSQFFGLTIEEFLKAGRKVVAHKELIGYNGAYIFKIDQSVVISTPAEIVDSISTRVQQLQNIEISQTQAFAEQLFDNVERTIGPCYQGYCTNESARAIETTDVRLLSESDQAALENFQQRIDEEAWEHSSIAPDKTTFGLFKDGDIVAAACLDMWTEKVANIGLVTHPLQQGNGCAKKLCAFATRFGLDLGYEMAYQTLLSNTAAVAVAQSTGYVEYANHLAVRFKTATSNVQAST
jgi:hypothetical protein